MGNNQTVELNTKLNEKIQQLRACNLKWHTRRRWDPSIIGHATLRRDNPSPMVWHNPNTGKPVDQAPNLYPNSMVELHADEGDFISKFVIEQGDWVTNIGIVNNGDDSNVKKNIKWLQYNHSPEKPNLTTQSVTDCVTYKLNDNGFLEFGTEELGIIKPSAEGSQKLRFTGKRLTGMRAFVTEKHIVNIQFEYVYVDIDDIDDDDTSTDDDHETPASRTKRKHK